MKKHRIPNSPFSTRLSGSAKETELRLRSIFQWKKKRPPVVLIILMALAALFCGGLVSCQPNGEEPSTDSGIVSPAPDNKEKSDDPAQEESAIQQPVDSVTYVTFDSLLSGRGAAGGYLPVSYVKDGVQLLTNELFTDGSSSHENYRSVYDLLSEEPQADQLNKTDYVASNGTWDFFPVEVEHKTYTLEDQPEQEEWIGHFQEKLSGVGVQDTPVIITEAWIFDWNGTETAVVNASNVIVSDLDAPSNNYVAGRTEEALPPEPKLPSGEHTATYIMSALFTRGNAPVDMVDIDYHYREVRREPWGLSYFPPDSGSFTQDFSAVQYDENGALIVCPIFYDASTELDHGVRQFRYSPEQYLVCDIDGDGEVELVGCWERNSSYECGHEVYQLTDGKPECVFRLIYF